MTNSTLIWYGICNSFEHDAVDVEDEGESKQAPPKSSDKVLPSPATNSTKGTTTWNAKVKPRRRFGWRLSEAV